MIITETNIVPSVQLGIPLILAYTKVINAIIIVNTEMISPTFDLFVLSFIIIPPCTQNINNPHYIVYNHYDAIYEHCGVVYEYPNRTTAKNFANLILFAS